MQGSRVLPVIVVLGVIVGLALVLPHPTSSVTAEATLTPMMYLPIVTNTSRRFFSADSPWNMPIAPDPEIDPDSDSMIATLGDSSNGGRLWINMDEWTVPIYYADANSPVYEVPCVNPWGACGPGFGDNVPIPDGAAPDPSDDGAMAVVDFSRHLSWDMARARRQGEGWIVEWGYVFDLSGDGVQSDGIGSCRGSGFPLVAGVIRLEEVQRGHIAHALAIAYDYPRANVYVYPASSTYGIGGPHTIPEGARIQLDPSLDLDSLGLSPEAKVIARALQEYGAYMSDYSGGVTLVAEGLYGKPDQSWSGVLEPDDLAAIPWQSFRVLKLPPLKTMPSSNDAAGGYNGNGKD